MEFGLFDHVDLRDAPLERIFAERIEFVAAAEQAGFSSYHIAEHHMTPLGMAPSPSVFLAAVARETTRIRLGPLVYLLPLYVPLRLIEEICMLDHLSGGRLDIGVGRGVSKYEVGYYGLDVGESWEIFDEIFDILIAGLTGERLDHHGKRFDYENVPMVLRPVQTPHPPIWYGVGGGAGLELAARKGMNMVALGPTSRIKKLVADCREAWRRHDGGPERLPAATATPIIGINRNVVIADSDAEAERIARPAYQYWYENLASLWRAHGDAPSAFIIDNYDTARREGMMIAGSPDTVRAAFEAQIAECGYEYPILQMAFGSLTHIEAMR